MCHRRRPERQDAQTTGCHKRQDGIRKAWPAGRSACSPPFGLCHPHRVSGPYQAGVCLLLMGSSRRHSDALAVLVCAADGELEAQLNIVLVRGLAELLQTRPPASLWVFVSARLSVGLTEAGAAAVLARVFLLACSCCGLTGRLRVEGGHSLSLFPPCAHLPHTATSWSRRQRGCSLRQAMPLALLFAVQSTFSGLGQRHDTQGVSIIMTWLPQLRAS